MNEQKISLIEVIVSWQGEGISIGQRMLLCRFKYCDRVCSWCDTLVKMRALQEAEFTLTRLQEIIDEQKCGILLTGGEPTYSSQLKQTINILNNLNYPEANVETNGLDLLELIKEVNPTKNIQYSYSPKIFNDHDYDTAVDLTKELVKYENVFIKVVMNEKDKFVIDYLDYITKFFPTNRIYLMPLGKTKEEMFSNAPFMFDMAEKYKTNVSSRMHLVYDFV